MEPALDHQSQCFADTSGHGIALGCNSGSQTKLGLPASLCISLDYIESAGIFNLACIIESEHIHTLVYVYSNKLCKRWVSNIYFQSFFWSWLNSERLLEISVRSLSCMALFDLCGSWYHIPIPSFFSSLIQGDWVSRSQGTLWLSPVTCFTILGSGARMAQGVAPTQGPMHTQCKYATGLAIGSSRPLRYSWLVCWCFCFCCFVLFHFVFFSVYSATEPLNPRPWLFSCEIENDISKWKYEKTLHLGEFVLLKQLWLSDMGPSLLHWICQSQLLYLDVNCSPMVYEQKAWYLRWRNEEALWGSWGRQSHALKGAV